MLRFILREVQLPTFRKSGTASYSRQLFSLSTCWAAEVTQPEVFPSQVTLYHPASCAFNCFVSFLLPLHPVDNICISSLVCLSGLGDPVGLILPWTAQLLLLFRLLSQAGCGFAHCSSSQVQWRDQVTVKLPVFTQMPDFSNRKPNSKHLCSLICSMSSYDDCTTSCLRFKYFCQHCFLIFSLKQHHQSSSFIFSLSSSH